MKHKLLEEKIREKRRILNESYMQSINVHCKLQKKIRANFGNLYIQNNLMVVRRKYSYLEMILIIVV